MAVITPDHVLVLAHSSHADAVLALVDGEAAVVPALDVTDDAVIYTRAQLLADYGDELTEIDADVLAAGLTARTSAA